MVALPLRAQSRRRGVFRLTSRFDLASVFEGMAPEARTVCLRLRFTARNYAWETDLTRPAAARPDTSSSPSDRTTSCTSSGGASRWTVRGRSPSGRSARLPVVVVVAS